MEQVEHCQQRHICNGMKLLKKKCLLHYLSLGFEKIDTAYQVRDRYQIAYDYYNLNNQNCT